MGLKLKDFFDIFRGMNNKEAERRVRLRNIAYNEVLRPRLIDAERLGIEEARKIIGKFNFENGADLMVRDFFICVIYADNNAELQLLEPPHIALKVARLTVDDCNVDLLDPKKSHLHEVLDIRKSMAQKVVKWLESE